MKTYTEWRTDAPKLDEFNAVAANRSGMIDSRAQAMPMTLLSGKIDMLLSRKVAEAERARPGTSQDPAAMFALKQDLMREIFAAVEKLLFAQDAGGGKMVNQARLGRAASKYDRAADLSRKGMGQGPQL